MTVEDLIDILSAIEDKSLKVVTMARPSTDSHNTYRGISQIWTEKDVLNNPRIVLADGTDKE